MTFCFQTITRQDNRCRYKVGLSMWGGEAAIPMAREIVRDGAFLGCRTTGKQDSINYTGTPVNSMNNTISYLLSASLSEQTKKAYARAWRHLKDYLEEEATLHSLPLSVDCIMGFYWTSVQFAIRSCNNHFFCVRYQFCTQGRYLWSNRCFRVAGG